MTMSNPTAMQAGPRQQHAGLLAMLCIAPLAVLVGFRITREGDDLELWLAQLLFWTMPFVLAFASVGGILRWRESEQPLYVRIRWMAPGAIYAIAIAVVLFALVPPQMRVQFDETSLVGSSQSMHRYEASLVTTGALPFDGDIVPRENTVDKRPPLFAFLVHLLHRVAGFQVANAFWVNGLLLVIGLFAVFQVVRTQLGPLAALAAPLCLLSVPVIGVTATSAGFDLMATVWLLVAVIAASDFVRRPDHGRFCWFLAAGMLLAQSRYESLPVAGLLGVIVFLRVRGRYRPNGIAAALLALSPALVLPIGFLLLHSQNPKFYPEAGGVPLLSLVHIADHVGPLLAEWFAPSFAGLFPGVLAVAGCLLLGLRLLKSQGSHEDLTIGLAVLAPTLIALAWFYGDAREQTAARLFLPLAWTTALLPLLAFQWLKRRAAIVCLAVISVFCGLRVRELANGHAFPQMPIASVTAELDELVASMPGERATTLWVGAPAQHLIVYGHAALTAAGFERRRADLQLSANRGDLLNVYFLQTSIDHQVASALGDVANVLPGLPVELVPHGDREMSIVIYRMKR
jgi:hypothetical protein